MKADELREKYLSFFETKGCVRRPSDVLVPRGDPSVLFTPAGMNQFKDHFLGRCKLEFTRATTCQKCLRTGDIDNVGRTAYHHTFFEMLGNFSFGDYFKREAITWAWEFLVDPKWLGIPPDRLSATVYLDDDDAWDIWEKEVGLPPERIQRIGEEENFWPASAPSQGPDGVCGPCSEIYYHTDHTQVEIWNLVFTQYNRVGDPPNNLRPLPSKNIDTGMGLERTAAVLQGVRSNFHIDILRPLVEAAGEVCSIRYEPESENGRRLRRIADHVRACTFAIHENVYPGPNKEKYVVKRLLRRAVLDGHQIGVREPFLHKLVGKVAELMKVPYPELSETVQRVAGVIEQEESNFMGTVDSGLARLEKVFEQMKGERRGMVAGRDVFEMYQTHGFPPELFETMAAERNFTVDWEGYQKEMEKHGEISGPTERVALFKKDALEALKKAMHGSEFLGYDSLEVDSARVVGIIAGGQLCDKVDEVDHERPIVVVLDKTPFYGEMGGQVGDRGEIAGEGFRFEVIDSQVDGAFTLHQGHLRAGEIRLGATATAKVDAGRRERIRRAHTATHLLHYALQKHLGRHAQQQGSKVDTDWFRFDFTHPSSLGRDEVLKVEDEVNAKIREGESVRATNMPLLEARKTGAMMLFGEKYPDIVRVVTVGDFSKELCGGTHLENAGQVEAFTILSEENIAAGTRRITALTGPAAVEHRRRSREALAKTLELLPGSKAGLPERIQELIKEVRHLRKQAAAGVKSEEPVASGAKAPRPAESQAIRDELALSQAAGALKTAIEEVPGRVEALLKEVEQLKQRAAQASSEAVSPEQLLASAETRSGVRVVVAEVHEAGPQALRQLIDQLRRQASPIAVLLGTRQGEDKVMLVAGLSRDLVERGCNAVDWVKEAASVVGGGGGGRPDMAQAGGKDPHKLPDALEKAREVIRRLL
jgi:alanyl-tRNA synthetase